MRNSGATSQNSVLFSARHFRIRDLVRPVRIQLHKLLHRTPWLPPFVLCVSQNLTSAALTNRSEDGGSQAERAIALRRGIALLRTKSRLSYTAWEVRVSVAPDFRLHPFSEIGSLPFCQLGRTKCQRTDPSKIPFKHQVCTKQTGYNSPKRFGGEFEGNLSSEKVPLKKKTIFYKLSISTIARLWEESSTASMTREHSTPSAKLGQVGVLFTMD